MRTSAPAARSACSRLVISAMTRKMLNNSFAATSDTPQIDAAVSAAAASAFVMFRVATKTASQPPPSTLSPHWKAEERARSLMCERVASPERPVVLNPMRQNVV